MAAVLTDLMQKMSLIQYSIGSEHWVHVAHINDPSDFYVRPTDYKDYVLQLQRYQGQADPSKINLGSVVAFKSNIAKCHVRGQIINIKHDNGVTLYALFALDYGFIEQASIDRLKESKETSMPATVLRCQLKDCQPKDVKFDDKAIEAMIFHVGHQRAKMIIHGRTAGKYVVQLINTCPEDIATTMALTGYSYLGYGNNVISRMPELDQPKLFYTYKQVKVGDTLHVRVQSGDSLKSFYVCEVDDHKEYIRESKELKEYHRENYFPAENLKCGRPLAVFSDWYARYERAVIKEVVAPEKKAVVQFVDWGVKMDVYIGVSRLKTLSKEYYFSRPAMAIYCSAEEKQVWDNGLHKFLYPGNEFVIIIKSVGHEFDTPNVMSIWVRLPKKEYYVLAKRADRLKIKCFILINYHVCFG